MTAERPLANARPGPLIDALNPELWRQVSAIADEAMELPAADARAFLDRSCGDNHQLHAAVERLLAADLAATGFLERPLLEPATPSWIRESRERAEDSANTLAPGVNLAGRYEIIKLLGRGGMGEVYEAWDADLSISVALKMLRLSAVGDKEELRRLKRESLLTRSISHANVCRVYDLGRHGEGKGALWFLTMEVLRGETLAERLRREDRLPPEGAVPLAQKMAAGLGAAHRAGVVHCDFKPSNVMLVRGESGEQPVVTDFGIGRATGAAWSALSGEEQFDLLAGTPAYMAPEQVRGEHAGPAADIYALGIVMYEMLTGGLPFPGGSATEVAMRRLVEDPQSPRSVAPELDERWDAVILRCLAREPSHRFRRAEDVAAALGGRVLAEEVETRDTAGRGRHTLPVERDTFIGRERELEELDHNLVGNSCLLTLTGPGGMGKTRLAVRYGWQSLEKWLGGVWFCDLTRAHSADEIAAAVAGSLGVPPGQNPIEQLGHALAGRGRCLVIMDNFDQVVKHAAATLCRWLARASDARFLVTSRERLGLADAENVQTVEALPPEEGLELFSARAHWLLPGLKLEGRELDAAREVVRLVEGMPLAIELAAARMRVMTASQIARQMRKRFQLLTGGSSARHETLAAVIHGSWQLLRPWEKAALAQCTVFEGGFTLEAAEAVLDLSAYPEAPWVIDVVQFLADKSVLTTSAPGGATGTWLPEPRFGMYASVQEYARGKLEEEGAVPGWSSGAQAARATEERHGRWYARCGTMQGHKAIADDEVRRLHQLTWELENLGAACRRAIERGDEETAVRTHAAVHVVVGLVGPFKMSIELAKSVLRLQLASHDRARVLRTLAAAEWSSGLMGEARAHLEAVLAFAREVNDRRLEGQVLGSLGILHSDKSQVDVARTYLEAALEIHREVGNRRLESHVMATLGNLQREQGRADEARAHYDVALAIAREVGDRRAEGIVLQNLGSLHGEQGRMETARDHYERALAIHHELGDRRSQSHIHANLGTLHLELGQVEEAWTHCEVALAVAREVGNRRLEGIVLGYLGNLHCRERSTENARDHYESALAIAREVGNRAFEGTVTGYLGNLYLQEGRTEKARTCYEGALAIARDVGNRRGEGKVLGYLANTYCSEGNAEEARRALDCGVAILREVGDHNDLAKLLCSRGELEHRNGDLCSARAAFREAQALAAQVGVGPNSELGRKVAALQQALEENP